MFLKEALAPGWTVLLHIISAAGVMCGAVHLLVDDGAIVAALHIVWALRGRGRNPRERGRRRILAIRRFWIVVLGRGSGMQRGERVRVHPPTQKGIRKGEFTITRAASNHKLPLPKNLAKAKAAGYASASAWASALGQPLTRYRPTRHPGSRCTLACS